MIHGRFLVAALSLLFHSTALAALPENFADMLAFEPTLAGHPLAGWEGGPRTTQSLDSMNVHGGRFAGHLVRDPTSPMTPSRFNTSIPADVAGQRLELRGWLRTMDVTGFAGLWLREDGRAGPLQFDNMESKNLHGTTEWTEYSIVLPLDPKARTFVFGALLVGEGRLWVDDLQLLVDGRPIAEAPARVVEESAVERDHEFDTGSGIETAALTPQQIQNLVTLGKTWGFVKYHHPRVTGGNVNWDYELFRVLPKVLQAGDRAAANTVLLDWLRGLGEPVPCDPCAPPPENTHLMPRLEWIRDANLLGGELVAALERIYRDRTPDGDQYYVTMKPGIGNPDFSDEAAYADKGLPDPGFRLLALYRHWNIIEYWFPYRDLIEESWDGVLAEFVPRLFASGSRDDYTLAMFELIGHVHDTHANLWGSLDVRPPRGACKVPVRMRFIEGKAVVTGYSDPERGPATGLRIGDVIEIVDGTPVDSIVTAWSPYYAASNEPRRLLDIARSLLKGECVPCQLKGRRSGKEFDITAERMPVDAPAPRVTHDRPGDTFQRLTDDIAYLKLSSVEAEKTADYVRAAAGTKGLVIDIRNYPSAFVVFALGQHLVTQPTEFVRFTWGDLKNPGAFHWGPPMSLTPTEPNYAGRIAILVDESTLSQAEYTAMAFRSAPGAIVVGSTTAAADGNVSHITLPGLGGTAISGIGVFYPDKTPTQRVGIVADVKVQPTVAGIRDGRDEVLEVAVAKLLGRKLTKDEIAKLKLGS